MLRPFDLLEQILIDIECDITEDINSEYFAEEYDLSEGHIRRIFRFAFGQTLASYIRSRKLAASINELLQTDSKLIDIALKYGFEYEQSYLRAFKREFGMTPGDLRKTGRAVKIRPPLHLFAENKISDDLILEPEFVVVPKFHVIGKRYRIAYRDPILAQEAAKDFWLNECKHISNVVNPNVYIGITRNVTAQEAITEYLPSVQVSSHKFIPNGLCADTFDTSLCARFRYIGQHHYYDINRVRAGEMYSAISKFANDKQTKYALADNKVFFEKIDAGLYDGEYCQMEWFAPVVEKA
jgi:AraC family transcriptional regulator